MQEIPINEANRIATIYGYDQIIIIGRKVGEEPEVHGEHVTTYGVNKENCEAAALIGNFLKYKIMKWSK